MTSVSKAEDDRHVEAPDAGELIDQYQVAIWRYLRALGCDSSLADDLTQETFLAVLTHPIRHISPAATALYLRRVAYHLLVSFRRRSKKIVPTDELERLDREWTRWAGFDNGDAALEYLTECIKRLTERAQLALQMRFRDRASREQIAAALGISQDGAKNLMQRAKLQLRECVERKLK